MGDWNIRQAIFLVDEGSVSRPAYQLSVKRGALLTSNFYIQESNRIRTAWSTTPDLSFNSARAFTPSIEQVIL
jgi:hypothetical protein